MNKRNHVTRLQARSELSTNGFVTAFSSPGRPELWARPKDRKSRFAIQRENRQRSQRWHIIDYPEPATCTPDALAELTARDGVTLNDLGTHYPGQIVSEFAWMD